MIGEFMDDVTARLFCSTCSQQRISHVQISGSSWNFCPFLFPFPFAVPVVVASVIKIQKENVFIMKQ
jgi:hypothetical protein